MFEKDAQFQDMMLIKEEYNILLAKLKENFDNEI